MSHEELAPAQPDGHDRAGHDPVLECVRHVARQFDRPSSAVVMMAGLALTEEGLLPFHQAEAAAERVGLRARTIRRPLRGLKAGDTPAILEMEDGKAALLLEVKDKQFRLYDPLTGQEAWRAPGRIAEAYAGRAVLLEPDPQRERQADDAQPAKVHEHWFWSEIWRVRGAFGYVALAAAVINCLAFAMPLFTMNVYDRVIPNRAVASLWVLALGVVLALALDFVLRLARARLIDEVGREVDEKLSQRLFEKAMSIPLESRSTSTGAFARRLADYEQIREFFASTTVVLIVDTVFVFLFLALIVVLGGWLVAVPLVGIAAMVMAGLSLQRAMARSLQDAQTDAGLQHSALVEAIGGVETLKAIGAEGRMLGRWRRYADMSAATQERLRRLTAIGVNLASLCQQGISIGLVVGGFYLFNAGKISMGAIIAIVMVAGRALTPVGQFAFIMTRARQALLTMDSLQRIMDAPDERMQSVRSVTPVISRGAIALDHLSFKYPGAETDSLADLNLKIEPGERVGLVGRVASGKSTLGRVICGLYQPTGGSYAIDGFDSRQHHPHQLRRAFRYVGQEAELFSGTVRDNLMLGAGQVEDADLIAAVERSGADLFLARDASGFDLAVGERGQRLSGGQRSFLALARALVEPSTLLFLDEPTGAMDTQSEQWFIEKLGKALRPEQTLIVSTHRTAMLALTQRLIVLDKGRVIADGPTEQVLGSVGIQR